MGAFTEKGSVDTVGSACSPGDGDVSCTFTCDVRSRTQVVMVCALQWYVDVKGVVAHRQAQLLARLARKPQAKRNNDLQEGFLSLRTASCIRHISASSL